MIRRREKDADGSPAGHPRIASPYDTDARWGVKREEFWLGYKLHITETCDTRGNCSTGHRGEPTAMPTPTPMVMPSRHRT